MRRPPRERVAPAGQTHLPPSWALGLCVLLLGVAGIACSGGKKPATQPESPEAVSVSDETVTTAESGTESAETVIETVVVETAVVEIAAPPPEASTQPPAQPPEPTRDDESAPPPLLAAPKIPVKPATHITLGRPQEPTPLVSAPVESTTPRSQYDPGDETLTVIREGSTEEGEPAGLWEVAEREKERRQDSEEVAIVITDRNLADMAAGGEITVASPGAETTAVEEEPASVVVEMSGREPVEATEPGPEDLAQDEAYWRSGALRIRTEMAEAAARIGGLETEAFQLRQRFYAEDDPFYRDGQIKPSWDRTLEELDDSRNEVLEKREELQVFLEEGHRAGALPGWLREGIELEPEIEFVEEGPIYHPGEPVVVEQDGKYDG